MAGARAREFFQVLTDLLLGSCLLLLYPLWLIYCLDITHGRQPMRAGQGRIQEEEEKNGFLIIYRLDLTLSVTAAGALLPFSRRAPERERERASITGTLVAAPYSIPAQATTMDDDDDDEVRLPCVSAMSFAGGK